MLSIALLILYHPSYHLLLHYHLLYTNFILRHLKRLLPPTNFLNGIHLIYKNNVLNNSLRHHIPLIHYQVQSHPFLIQILNLLYYGLIMSIANVQHQTSIQQALLPFLTFHLFQVIGLILLLIIPSFILLA